MPGARRSRPSNSFPCVIADQCPDDAHCNKSFPTIEKHNEHLKRCHSSDFWCLKCLHKFNCSLPAGPLGLAKKEHDKTQCPGKPSPENRQLWAGTWIMNSEQYNRFKDRGWKKTDVSNEVLLGCDKDSVPQKSWRKIRETIFPGSDDAAIRRRRSELEASRRTEDIRVMVAQVDSRPSLLSQLRIDFQAPSADAMQPPLPNAFPPSVPTDDSQLSIIFSEGTDFGTHLSSRVWSHSGGDEQDQPYGFDLAGPPASMPYFSHVHEDCHENQALGSMASGAVVQDAMPPLPPEVLLQVGTGAPLTGSKGRRRSRRV